MKNFRKLTITFLIVFLVLISISLEGCSPSPQNESNVSDSDQLKIGLLLDTLEEERWQRDRDIFVAEANKLGAEVLVQVANGDDRRQLEQSKKLLNEKIDVLVVVPHDSVYSKRIVDAAHDKGVPVIAYDRLIEGDVDYYISFDNKKVGKMQATYILNELKIDSGNFVYIGGDPKDNNSKLFREGVMEVLNRNNQIDVIYDKYTDEWKPTKAEEHMSNALEITRDIAAVICANDGTASGAINVLAQNKVDTVLVGMDAELTACQRIVEGRQDLTIFKDVRNLAKVAAEVAVKIARGETVDANDQIETSTYTIPAILLEPKIVDKNNMVDMIIKSGYHRFEDVYRNIPKDERPNIAE